MTDRRSRQLLAISAAVIVLQGIVLTLSPAVRQRSWDVELRWSHWLGIIVWGLAFAALQVATERAMPRRDPLLLPVASLLSGLGLLTIWRLDATFGIRQAVWLIVSGVVAAWLVSQWGDLRLLRRFRYLLLGGGLLLTAMTIVLGTSPTGNGPRLWLGCCGIYLQPSEPLKLLLVIYLAAYLADHPQLRQRAFPLIVPTMLITGLALILLIVQKDLGSASILIVLYTLMLYTATERRRVLIATVIALGLAAITGYYLVDIIQARLESWLNPWLDPSGASYQILQSLLSIANGGLVGRGLGIGSPGLVPVAHSDFIYSAIAEEAGLAGSVAVLATLALLFARGLRISARASDRFQRLLASGVTAYLGVQSLLIIGGDLRLLPLTGVTLPFVSYGGSSFLTSSIALAMLLSISAHRALPQRQNIPSLLPRWLMPALLATGIGAAVLIHAWWSVFRGPDLLARTDNPRRSIADRYVLRGGILDRNSVPFSETLGGSGAYQRVYRYWEVSSVIGYTHAAFGQAGLEASLDPFLRGTQGNPASLVLWDELVYGTPPPGLDVRLTLDVQLQSRADELLGDSAGAIVLMNASSGEVLAMASHPSFDANNLDQVGATLGEDPGHPLLNRAAQGSYELVDAALPYITAARIDVPGTPVESVYRLLGFFDAPQIRMPVHDPVEPTHMRDARISPLQMAMAAATLSNHGVRPPARIALAVNTPREGWVVLPALGSPRQAYSSSAADSAAIHYGVAREVMWRWRVSSAATGQALTWFVAGTLPDWAGMPAVVVVVLENTDVALATEIGASLLRAATAP